MAVGSDEDGIDVLVDEVVVGSIPVGTADAKETLQGHHALLESFIALAEVRDLPTEGSDLLLLPNDDALLALFPIDEDASDASGGGGFADVP